MKKIKNTYVIEFYDHLESKTSHYIFLELAEGGTLRTRLRMNGGRFD
jgi:serine/threonine protein kinase